MWWLFKEIIWEYDTQAEYRLRRAIKNGRGEKSKRHRELFR